jgi:transcriptional regulator with XRE-family HTH domain
MDWRQIIAAQLARHRSRRKLSQSELAERAKVDPALIKRIEAGGANPSLATVARLAKALDIEPMELLAPLPGRQRAPEYPYERFRFADGALAKRCGLPEELVGLATATADREAIIELSSILAERLQRRSAVRKSGEAAPVRRGMVAAYSDVAILAVNMLMVCFAARFTLPAELARLFVLLHGLEEPPGPGPYARVRKNQVLTYYTLNPEASLRAASRATKVPVTTIRHWQADPEFRATLAGMQAAHSLGCFTSIW